MFKCECLCEYSELFEKVRQDADQLRAAQLIASEPVVVLSGKGGCGKTEVVSAVISYTLAKINSEKYVTYIVELVLINIIHNSVALAFGCVKNARDSASLIFSCFIQIKCAFIVNLIPREVITYLIIIIDNE